MKKVRYFWIGCLAVLTGTGMHRAGAAEVSFTAVASDGKSVFAGWKRTEQGSVPKTALVVIRGSKADAVKLPEELSGRELVALIPGKKNVFVLSQQTVEQGDDPQLHVYQTATRRWKKVGQADCPAFAELKIAAGKLVLHCEDTTAEAPTFADKAITISGEKLPESGPLKLPQTQADRGALRASLDGEPFQWKRIKISDSGKEQVVDAERFLK